MAILTRPAFLLTALTICAAAYALMAHSAMGESSHPQKQPLVGLVSTGRLGFNQVDGAIPDDSIGDVAKIPGVFTGLVVNMSWAQLQPKRDSFEFPALRSALIPVSYFNRKNPRFHMRVRLRVWSGAVAPEWVKKMGKGPVTVVSGGKQIHIPCFWTQEYRDAWRLLQQKLAGMFDADPLIAEVTNTLGSSITDEPFVLPADALSIGNLRAAGFRDSEYQRTLGSTADAYAAWKATPVEYSFEPLYSIQSGKPHIEPAVTLGIMRKFREDFGERGIICNYHLTGQPASSLKPIFAEMKKLGDPMEFQMTEVDHDKWPATIEFCHWLGCHTIEVRPTNGSKGFTDLTRAQLIKYANALIGK